MLLIIQNWVVLIIAVERALKKYFSPDFINEEVKLREI